GAGRSGGSGHSSRSPPAPQALRLPAECMLAGAESLKLRLSELVQLVQVVTIDTADVRRIDTATLQLLAAFARDRRNGAFELRMAGESAVFEESARLLGLADLLGRPSA
ncbi:MAG: STAS domain-containing protein, partial [Steroidobacteraceae bacterium]